MMYGFPETFPFVHLILSSSDLMVNPKCLVVQNFYPSTYYNYQNILRERETRFKESKKQKQLTYPQESFWRLHQILSTSR